MDVVVTAEVADGAVTPPDMAYVVDQLQRTCGEDAGRVRRDERSSSDLTPAESASPRQH
jgi:hypothetical protein